MALDVLQVLSDTTTKSRLLAITCDNASNNRTIARAIQTKLGDKDIHWDANKNLVLCLAHIINLVVQDIIQHLKLEALIEVEAGETLQRRHVHEIQAQMSIPNSLRKVCTLLSHTFITS
jgi:alpha-D-ribose 1-methylphosphonate 5-triphosphate synthase subunit PhnI